MIRKAGHCFAYYLLRPTVQVMPPILFAAAARAVSVPLGMALAVAHRRRMATILEALDQSRSPASMLRFALGEARERIRNAEYYLYAANLRIRTIWETPPTEGPCVYVSVNTFGLEAIDPWMLQNPAILVRLRWDGESERDPATASPAEKWRAYQAWFRKTRGVGREVIVGDSPLAYRHAVSAGKSIVIYQDVSSPSPSNKKYSLLGRPTSLTLGALRLAKIAGDWPIRFLTVHPRGGTWTYRVTAPIDPTPEALLSRIEAEIRRRPYAWSLWDRWLEEQGLSA